MSVVVVALGLSLSASRADTLRHCSISFFSVSMSCVLHESYVHTFNYNYPYIKLQQRSKPAV